MTANLSLTRGQRVTLELGGSETLGFEDVVVESIEAGPSEAYPAGSGVSVTLIVEGGGSPERRQVSLLSSGYRSHPVAWPSLGRRLSITRGPCRHLRYRPAWIRSRSSAGVHKAAR